MINFALRWASAIVATSLLISTAAHADCTLDAKVLVSGMVKLPPFHLAIKTAANGVESRMTGDVIMPNSFRLVFGNSSTIMTPRGAWTSDKGKWKAQSQDVALGMRRVLLNGITDGLSTMRNVKCNPKAKINGKVYKAIEFDTYDKLKDKKPLAHVTFYLNNGNLPLWMITQGQTGKTKSAIVQQFTYDPSIKIEDPK
jgi:hypothetical protein